MLTVLVFILGAIGLIIITFIGISYYRRPKFDTKKFTILEKKLLDTFTSLFNPVTTDKLKNQILHFENKTKLRHYWDKSMTLELYGDNSLPENLKYPRRDESKIATIRFKVNAEKFTIEFDSYNGRIWGWKIRPNPKKIQNTNAIVIISKKINNDPNEKIEVKIEKEEMTLIPSFDGVLEKITKITPIEKAYVPLISQQLKFFEKRITSKLPQQYLKIISQSEGVEFENFRILGISEIQQTGLDNGNYFHLVEFDDGILAVKEFETDGNLYFCHFSNGLIDELGINFNEVLINKTLT